MAPTGRARRRRWTARLRPERRYHRLRRHLPAPARADPGHLAQILRNHWHIENRLHRIRDVTFGEDLSQARTGNGPRVMAGIRNLVINILRLTGATNIAAGLRHHSRRRRL